MNIKNLFTSYIRPVQLLAGSMLAILLAACTDELAQDTMPQTTGEAEVISAPSTLTVSWADAADTRLAFEKTDIGGREAFMSTWTEDDGFRLVGRKPTWTDGDPEDVTKFMIFSLAYGAGTTEGIFSSDDEAVSSSAFMLYYPSTLTSYRDYQLFSYKGQVQRGNDNYDHIADYHAMCLIWIRDLDNIVLDTSNENFSQSSCMKFVLSGLPETFVPVSLQWSIVDAEGNILPEILLEYNNHLNFVPHWGLTLEDFEPANSITAYLMLPDQDFTLPEGAQMRVSVTGSEGEFYYADKPAGGKTFQGGCLNTLTITDEWTKPYESTDFSRNGKVTVLQTAEQGEDRGIDVVIIGDGFSDRLLADGTYDQVMQKAYEDFFCIEPYISFKEKFNVYQIDAVSRHEDMEYGERETAFGSWFGSGTYIYGDNNAIRSFVQNAIQADDDRMNSMTVIVMINSTRYAGTCHMFGSYPNDFGDGLAIAYVPTGASDEERRGILLHEGCGHAFGKLGDEYGTATGIHGSIIADAKLYRENYGWYKNIDFTDDPNEVYWKDFIGDAHYPEIGIYEGGQGYAYEVYRPTENSIMRDNTGEFNAPSRRAIFYRINKMLDPAFTDDYETFVKWDVTRNLVQHPATGTRSISRKEFVPLAPPVVHIGYWENGVFITE